MLHRLHHRLLRAWIDARLQARSRVSLWLRTHSSSRPRLTDSDAPAHPALLLCRSGYVPSGARSPPSGVSGKAGRWRKVGCEVHNKVALLRLSVEAGHASSAVWPVQSPLRSEHCTLSTLRCHTASTPLRSIARYATTCCPDITLTAIATDAVRSPPATRPQVTSSHHQTQLSVRATTDPYHLHPQHQPSIKPTNPALTSLPRPNLSTLLE